MGRAERRRAQKCEEKAKTATYNLTRAQLDAQSGDDSSAYSAAGSADGSLLAEVIRKADSGVYRACSRIL
mgnify:CR=1 FL=1